MVVSLIENHYKENRFRLAKKMSFKTGTPEDGEDLVQTAYERCLRYHRSFDGTDFNRWFNMILLNVFREFKNDQKGIVHTDIDDEEEQEAPCYLYSSRVMAEIYGLIETKSPVQREVLMLYFHQEYSAKDISKILIHSYAQIHQIIQRFRNELKEVYKD